MGTRRQRRRSLARMAALGLLALAVLQACGQGGRSTAPGGAGQVSLTLRRATGELPAGCTGQLQVTGPGGQPSLQVTIPPSGVVTVAVPTGIPLTFTVILQCPEGTVTGTTTATLGAGASDITVTVSRNQPPRGVSVACSPSTVDLGQAASCTCRASDANADLLAFAWSISGGSPGSASGPGVAVSSDRPGTIALTCTVSDGKATASGSAAVTVRAPDEPPAPGTVVVRNTASDCSNCDIRVSFSGPAPVPTIGTLGPSASATRTGVPAGTYIATASCVSEYGTPSPRRQTRTVTGGQTTTFAFDGVPCDDF